MKLVASCLCCEGGDAELGGGDAAVLRRGLRLRRRAAAVAQGGAAQVAQRRRRVRRLRLQRRRGRGRGRRRRAQTPRSAHLFSSVIPSPISCARAALIRSAGSKMGGFLVCGLECRQPHCEFATQIASQWIIGKSSQLNCSLLAVSSEFMAHERHQFSFVLAWP